LPVFLVPANAGTDPSLGNAGAGTCQRLPPVLPEGAQTALGNDLPAVLIFLTELALSLSPQAALPPCPRTATVAANHNRNLEHS